MAIDEGKGFTQPRTGPKAFSEYTLGALLVFVGLVGSLLVTLGSVSLYGLLLFLGGAISYFPFFGVPFVAGAIGVLMLPFGILQAYYAWKLHSEDFRDFQRVIIISTLMIILSVVAAALSGLLFLFTLQMTLGQILLNALVIFFLHKPEIQAEFVWSTVEY
jgi:hypothetical protein